MDLMISACVFTLPCWCGLVEQQAQGMTCVSGYVPFRPHGTQQMGVGFGQIWQNALDTNDALWFVPLSTELMTGTHIFHLPCQSMAMD